MCGRVLTIHNNPENLRLPPRFQRLSFTLADVDTQDVSPFFAPSYDFIEAARAAREGACSSFSLFGVIWNQQPGAGW